MKTPSVDEVKESRMGKTLNKLVKNGELKIEIGYGFSCNVDSAMVKKSKEIMDKWKQEFKIEEERLKQSLLKMDDDKQGENGESKKRV